MDGQWLENTIHSFALGNAQRPYQKGVLRRIYDSMIGTFSTGIFISTNKSCDRNRDEQDKGYIVPWEHKEVLFWCQKLRDWQERYNAINKPVSCESLLVKHVGHIKSEQQFNELGSFCFLFRDAAAKGDDRTKPIIQGKPESIWDKLLQTLEDQLFARGQTLSNGQPLKLVCNYPDDYQNQISKTQNQPPCFPCIV